MSDTFQVKPTPLDAIPGIVAQLNTTFQSGKNLPIEIRKQQLRQMWKLMDNEIREAVTKDIGKPLVQTQVLEIILVKNDIKDCLDNLDKWLVTESVAVPPSFENWSPVIERRPKGNCLVIGAWNYPIALTLLPFFGVIASGNTGILKPSELAPHPATLPTTLFFKYLDTTSFRVINGPASVAQSLLQHPFGHILFTGGSSVGKLVMKASAAHLAPVTLELGGKNAAIVTEHADVELVATRTMWANEEDKATYYGDKADVGKVGKIVNLAHHHRLTSLLSSTHGTVILGGQHNASERFIMPTVITNLQSSDPIVQDERFGPILPILTYSSPAGLIRFQRELSPTPLAIYVFSSDLAQTKETIAKSSAGTASINDCIGQIAPTSLPFGGFGASGIGAYRGKISIDTFSHKQSVVNVPTAEEFEALLQWRYPYAEGMETVEALKAGLEAKISSLELDIFEDSTAA